MHNLFILFVAFIALNAFAFIWAAAHAIQIYRTDRRIRAYAQLRIVAKPRRIVRTAHA